MATRAPVDEKFEKTEFDLFEALSALDKKDYGYYDRLTAEQQKKFVPFMMLHWMSAVKGSEGVQRYYVMSVNEYANKYYFNEHIQQHPKLQWLCATTVSPDMGPQRHNWIAPKKKEAGNNAIRKQLAEFFPHLKDDELKLMAEINTDADLKEYAKGLGWSDKDIKKEL